jgi:hypothetical protein
MVDPIAMNKRVWDAWTAIHVDSAFYDVASFRDGRRGIRLSDYEREEVGDVTGKTLLHLQCHFGMDTLSWARLGATVTGADFSPAAVDAARKLADEVGLGWLPDIRRWATVAAHFVKPGGFLYVTEIHPVAQVFNDDDDVAPGELSLRYPYWEHEEPISIEVQGSYADRTAPTAGLVENGWDHSMGEIVTALIDAGLRLDFLHEFDFVNWPVPWLVKSDDDGRYRLPPGTKGELPLFFSLKATKPPA